MLKDLKNKLIYNVKQFERILQMSSEGVYVLYLNPFNYFFYREKPEILEKVDFIHIDNMFFTFLFSILFRRKIYRLSFDINMLAPIVFDFCIKNNKTIFFTGGTEEEINLFILKIQKNYPDLKIKGYANGFLDDESILNKWLEVGKSDFFIVGLGNIRQENFVIKLKKTNEKIFCMSCGGFISQTARSKSLEYYPYLIYKLNLRWFYRIFKEKGILRRILIFYPKSLLYIFCDSLRNKTHDY